LYKNLILSNNIGILESSLGDSLLQVFVESKVNDENSKYNLKIGFLNAFKIVLAVASLSSRAAFVTNKFNEFQCYNTPSQTACKT
jgi:hypothetical protein